MLGGGPSAGGPTQGIPYGLRYKTQTCNHREVDILRGDLAVGSALPQAATTRCPLASPTVSHHTVIRDRDCNDFMPDSYFLEGHVGPGSSMSSGLANLRSLVRFGGGGGGV